MCFKSHGIKNSLTIFSFYYLSSPPLRLRGILKSPAMLFRYAMACRSHCNDDSPGSNGTTTSTMTSSGLVDSGLEKKMHLATLKLESKFKVPPPIFLGEGGRGEARVSSLNQPSLENCSKKKSGGHERIKPNTQRTPTTCFSSNFRFDVPNQGEKKHVLKQS